MNSPDTDEVDIYISEFLADDAALDDIFDEITDEMDRQDDKWGDQSHLPDGTGTEADKQELGMWRALNESAVERKTLNWKLILLEETWEVCAESDPEKMRTELVQVMAVAAQWIKALDKRSSK